MAHRTFLRRLSEFASRARAWVLPFTAQHGERADSFQLGGSLPIHASPADALHAVLLPRPRGRARIHAVRGMVVTSLPWATIGRLAMANAARVMNEAMP